MPILVCHIQIKKAIVHLGSELSRLSCIECFKAKAEVLSCKEQYRTMIASENQDQNEILQMQEKINVAMNTVGQINLGIEPFFRELSQLYQISFSIPLDSYNDQVLKLSLYCAQLLIEGSAIELLDGDAGTISINWIVAICKNVMDLCQGFKVFVVSIIGFQSSGKSTLLNALFSCNFAVSVGRCSRGLFMRLAFIEGSLRESYGFDAFLIIDTEGLGSPEKMNDKDAEKKDRMMATFAMGVSDLTIINVMGETMAEMTEILQIAILAMARLEMTEMSSDILLVQHLSEKNDSKMSACKDSFIKAIEFAFNLAKNNHAEIGVLNSGFLTNLTQRIRSGKFLKLFGPLKDGPSVNAAPSKNYHADVVDLYKTILSISKQSSNKHTFYYWSRIVESYWSCVSQENFALCFKNAKKMIEFIDSEQKLANVREAIERAFQNHREKFESQMRMHIHANKAEYLERVGMLIENLPQSCCDLFDDLAQLSTAGNPHAKEAKSAIGTDCLMVTYQCEVTEIMPAHSREPEACQHCKRSCSQISNINNNAKGKDRELEIKHKIGIYIQQACQNTLKVLSQTFDAMVLQEQFGEEYAAVVNKELRALLKENPSGDFSINYQDEINRIWSKLQQLASAQQKLEPLSYRIESAIADAYNNVSSIIELYRKEVTEAELSKTTAIDVENVNLLHKLAHVTHHSRCLSKQQVAGMINRLKSVVRLIFDSRDS